MSDIADDADGQIQQELSRNLARRMPELEPCGFCYFCDEQVSGNRLFCDNGKGEDMGCFADYHNLEQAKKRIGN